MDNKIKKISVIELYDLLTTEEKELFKKIIITDNTIEQDKKTLTELPEDVLHIDTMDNSYIINNYIDNEFSRFSEFILYMMYMASPFLNGNNNIDHFANIINIDLVPFDKNKLNTDNLNYIFNIITAFNRERETNAVSSFKKFMIDAHSVKIKKELEQNIYNFYKCRQNFTK